ncbi:ATP-binding cassette domain-containing protein [Kitasatospora purpeofusca]|uniref:ATP-binding cassette domain-containing protein n=1 Tax=Kitasatospora purpeofusca TaxID=67352 RepID=UPI002A59E205|nr:ATP-binding cassette domain-containing protein [Kitasatospora purpeofusca]MDY0813543.1 ATP-binding cassette domain-containing protein [Kitasatospora purpeofusca]
MALEFQRIEFQYGRKASLFNGLDLRIDNPATVLLGPNGAGKSTLMALAASQLSPRRGSVSWHGVDPAAGAGERAAYRRAVAWLPQQITPVPGLSVREQVAYCGWLKGMSRAAAWRASAVALARVGLGELADRSGQRLSGGQLRRMGIAGCLAHHSELILMDEPTAGLDPTQRAVFRALVEELTSEVSVIVSTHQTEDLVGTYRQVVVLDRGQVRFQGATEEFHALAAEGATGSGSGAGADSGRPTAAVPGPGTGTVAGAPSAEAAYARLIERET